MSGTRPGRPRWIGLLAVTLALGAVGVLFVAVYPTQALLDQNAETRESRDELGELLEENQRLEDRAAELRTDAAVEQLARDEYGLVYPGEEAFAILPGDGPSYPAIWPFTQLPGSDDDGSQR